MPIMIESKGRKPKAWSLDGEESFPTVKASEITLLQADGDELRIILDNYHNVPRTNESSQMWVEPFANQIFVNLHGVIASHENRHENQSTGPVE